MKYLGVYLDQNHCFQEEFKSILKKMACGIKTISGIKKGLPIKTRIKLLSVPVLSHLHYSATLLSGISKKLISLEKQLSWVVKTCCHRRKYDTSSDLKLKHEILPVSFFLKFKITVYFYKINQNKITPYRKLDFPNSQIIKPKRTGLKYHPVRSNCQIFQNSIFS